MASKSHNKATWAIKSILHGIGKNRALHVSDGTGRGSIGNKVSSDTRGLWFDSHQQTHHCYIIGYFFKKLLLRTDKIKGKKRPGMVPTFTNDRNLRI